MPEYEWSQPKIDVRIAFEPKAQLGREYNRIMKGTSLGWVLFLDQDVLLLNPHWYAVCQEAIRKHPDAGIFTAYTNECAAWFTKANNAPARDAPIVQHRNYAKSIWQKNQYSVTRIDVGDKPHRINGFFMLTSKKAWARVGGFRGTEMFGEDTEYHRRMIQYGIQCYRIDGLYVFHMHERIDNSWIPGAKTSKEYWLEFKRRRDERKKNSLHRHHGAIRGAHPGAPRAA